MDINSTISEKGLNDLDDSASNSRSSNITCNIA